MDERTLKALEFPRVLESLSSRCMSEAGKEAALKLRPLPNPDAVRHEQTLFEEARIWQAEDDFRPTSFPDLSDVLTFLRGPAPLLEHDGLWAVKEVLQLAKRAVLSVQEGGARRPALLAQAENLPQPEMSLAALVRCIGDDGYIKDESSPGLLLVRTEMRGLHQNCSRRVKDYAEKYNISHYLQDDYITLASDRYVLPMKANFKGRLQGIIHDYSRTGETLYFEPLFLVEQNNRLQELKQAEREEERKVLRHLTDLLLQELPQVESAWNFLITVDVVCAKCALAATLDGRCVPLDNEAPLHLPVARHPLLVLEAASRTDRQPDAKRPALRTVEPMDLLLRAGDRILVISGGNAGGKTVALKTLGLITLMTLAGLPAPCGPGSTLPVWQRVHAFIGDEQSLEDHVSTFTGQIQHLAGIWDTLDSHSLVLLDEFGAGTDPSQGAALAQAVLDGLLEKNVYALTATHFPALKTYALTREKVRAASVLFDPSTKKPLFHLAYDQVGASQALDVAREHGLPENVLRRAEHYLLMDGQDSGAIMDRLNALAREREEELDALKEEQTRLREKRRQVQERGEKEQARLHDELRQKSQELMHAWKAGKATAKQALKEIAGLRAGLAKSSVPEQEGQAVAVPTAAQFRVGEYVRHRPWDKRAMVLEVDPRGGRAKIDLNGVTMWAALSDMEPGLPATQKTTGRSSGVVTRVSAPVSLLRLDLRGKRADLALVELEQFLDRALLAGPEGVEIIHGRGTGALRKSVHQFLKQYPGIASYSIASDDQGGDGVTLVTFR